MVINADGIKLNGVAPSVWSMWYFFLEMIELPRYSCVPASYDTSKHVCAGPIGRTAPIGHAETDRSTGRSHRLTCQGPEGSRERFVEPTARTSSTHPLRSSRERKIVRYSPQSRSGCLYSFSCFPSEMTKRTGRTLVRPLGLQFRPDQEPLVRNDAGRNNVHPWRARAKIGCTTLLGRSAPCRRTPCRRTSVCQRGGLAAPSIGLLRAPRLSS